MVAIALAIGAPAEAAARWPRELRLEKGVLVVYQPQVETLEGVTLTGRMAVSWEKSGTAPVFGVVWFESRFLSDKDTREVHVEDFTVRKVRFPQSTPEQEAQFSDYFEKEVPKWDLRPSFEELENSVAASKRQTQSEKRLKSDPPKFVFSNDPAVLLLYDGQPLLRPIEKTELQRAVNTPFFVVCEPAAHKCYLTGAKFWYEAPEAIGPWTKVEAPSPAVKAFFDANPPPPPGNDAATEEQREAAKKGVEEMKTPPRIVVATEPTELITFDGPPNYVPVGSSGDLLFADNSDGKVLVYAPASDTYLLAAGRWFKAKSLKGPWTAVRPDKLPKAFKDIPPGSPIADVRTFVTGTDEAQDALADTQIPQTTAVKRNQSITVVYDGEPKFKEIEGTNLAYAVNTSFSVIRDSGSFWVCHQAVWYVSDQPKGPWKVSDKRPPSIDSVPPSAPVYNTKYVYVYQTTPEVVYVGYLPGYVQTYPYYGTVVYGTGYVYPAYVSPVVYYPPPVTFGVHMTYNPWMGFGVGVSYGTPYFSVGIHFGGYPGWYGPVGYRPPYYPPYGYRPPPPGWHHAGYPSGGYPGGYPGGRPGGAGGVGGVGGAGGVGGVGGAGGVGGVGGVGGPGGAGGVGGAGGGPSASQLPAGGGGSGARPSQLPSNNNLYNRPGNADRNANRAPSASTRPAGTPSARPNDVYGDRSGNVHRQNSGGSWDHQTSQGWQADRAGSGTRPASTADRGSSGGAPSGLDRDAAARNRGGGGGSGGGRGGGGGRRR
jgi:hypothetical protein